MKAIMEYLPQNKYYTIYIIIISIQLFSVQYSTLKGKFYIFYKCKTL
jgi:hypothetical protein